MSQVAALKSLGATWKWIDMQRKRHLREQTEC